MDAYERSLKQQAERIRRELSQEGKKNAPAPKPEPSAEFIPSDVPSPIYGYARPKPKINLPIEHSPETRDDLSAPQGEPTTEEMVMTETSQQESMFVPDEIVVEVDESMASPFNVGDDLQDEPATEESVPSTSLQQEPTFVSDEMARDAEESVESGSVVEDGSIETQITEPSPDLHEPFISPETSEQSDQFPATEPEMKPSIGEVSILDGGFASVFMGSTDLKSSKIIVREEKVEAASADVSVEVTSVEDVAPVIEDVAKTLQSEPSEPEQVLDEAELTPAVAVSYKADHPPVNVLMTPQDRMAMYRSRRLAQNNNNL